MWIFTSHYIFLKQKNAQYTSEWEDKKLAAYCFLACSRRSVPFRVQHSTTWNRRSVSMISIILLVCWGSWPHTLFFFLVLELVFLSMICFHLWEWSPTVWFAQLSWAIKKITFFQKNFFSFCCYFAWLLIGLFVGFLVDQWIDLLLK